MDDLGLPPFLETSKNNSFFCLRMGHTKFFQEQKVVFQSPELAMIYGLCMICLAFGGTRILNSLHGQPIINLQISKVSIPPISKFGMVYGFGTWKIGEVSLFPQPVGERAGWIGIGVFSVGGPLLLYLILRRKKLLGSQGQPGVARWDWRDCQGLTEYPVLCPSNISVFFGVATYFATLSHTLRHHPFWGWNAEMVDGLAGLASFIFWHPEAMHTFHGTPKLC
jgi:hypothetical protein